MGKTVIILGSARKGGDTGKMVTLLSELSGWDIIDLNDYRFSHYDYEHKNREDDYIPLLKKIVGNYDTLVFATPVYWYAMSGLMKMFFDRLTDLLTIEKDLGRALRGKNMAAISCSAGGGNLEEMFWFPFRESADYLGMNYMGNVHFVTDTDEKANIEKFIALVNQ